MKKIYILLLLIISGSVTAQIEGTWKLAPIAGALGVGPNQGDVSWWSNSTADVTVRDCLFDDSISFDANGNFMHYMDGNTWLETWQGVASDQCGTPVAPHDGSGSYTYTYSNNQLTVNGTGAHIGLAKVTNAGEISGGAPVASTITYEIMMSANGDTMTTDIDFGGGWWRFVYTKSIPSSSSSSLEGTWKLAPVAGALGVGPNQGDVSWWSNSTADVTVRDCLFDDSISFDANGNFMHYMDGNTWLETWQGVASEQCGTPVAPHDGSGSYTYTYSNNQLTVNGTGAHIGLAKVTNAGEISGGAPVASTITYEIMMSSSGDTMTVDIDFGGGWWRFVYTKSIPSSSSSSLEGTWKLAPVAGALGVGPNQGDVSWWSNSTADVTVRDCLFDDSISFDANGNFMHYMDGNTWLETWQGVASEQCGTPVAPHDGSGSYTYTYSNNQLTVNGTGAHIGLAKVTNAGEISGGAPVASTITYEIMMSASGDTMTADIDFGGGWWRFVYTKSIPSSSSSSLEGTWELTPAAGSLGVGPTQGDGSWWSNSLNDVTVRDCLFDDSISFDANGNFMHYMDGNTWLETWQGVASEQCGTPVAPHDGSGSYTYTYSNNQLTVNGTGAHIGLAKVTNAGEISGGAPVASTITYEIMMSADGDTMTTDIDFGGGWWRFVYQRTNLGSPPPTPTYTVSFEVHTDLITGNISNDGIYAGGGALGSHDALLLDDSDGDGVWTGSAIFPAAGGNYTLLNGNCSDWSCKEDISGQACADASNWNDRLLPALSADTTLVLQFGSCDTPSSINENSNHSILLYPNPASDQLNILFDSNLDKIIIRDLLGKEVININNIVGNNQIINLKDLSNNIYLVEIHIEDKVITKKLSISK